MADNTSLTPKPTPPAGPKPATKAVTAKSASPQATPPGVSPETYAATMAALAKVASQATPAKPVPGKFYLQGFDRVLPIESQFGFSLLQRELAAIPPKHFAANERQSLNTALESLAHDVAKFGVNAATMASCRELITAVRRQAKICAARAHTADIKTDSEIRLQEAERKARAEKRAASRATEFKGGGTPGELAKVNALPVSVEPVFEAPRPGAKDRRRRAKAAKKDRILANRPYEE